jgi:hypothetical protein
MQITPLKSYPAPAYPTHEARRSMPSLLARIPLRWQGNSRVLTALALTCGLVWPSTNALAEDDVLLQPQTTSPDTQTYQFDPYHYSITMGVTSNPSAYVMPDIQVKLIRISPTVWTINDILTCPLRDFLTHLDATARYDNNQVTVQRGKTTLVLHLNSTRAALNGKPIKLPLRIREKDGRVRVPVRAVVEALGGRVDWYAKTQIVDIRKSPTDQNPLSRQCTHHFRAAAPAPHTIAAAEVKEFIAWLKMEGIV